MNFDWITGLGVADQSLEAQLAKRDLSKKLNMVRDLARFTEDVRGNQAQEEFRQKQLEEQTRARMAQEAMTQEWRNTQLQHQKEAEARLMGNTVSDNLQRQVHSGVTPQVNEETAALLRGVGEGANLTAHKVGGELPTEGSGEGTGHNEYLYRQQEAEAAALKAKHDQQRQEEQDKRAAEAAARDQERLKLAQSEAAERTKTRELARSRTRQLIDQGNKTVEKLQPEYRRMAEANAKQRVDNEHQTWTEWLNGDEQGVEVRSAQIRAEEIEKARARQDAALHGKGVGTPTVPANPQVAKKTLTVTINGQPVTITEK